MLIYGFVFMFEVYVWRQTRHGSSISVFLLILVCLLLVWRISNLLYRRVMVLMTARMRDFMLVTIIRWICA